MKTLCIVNIQKNEHLINQNGSCILHKPLFRCLNATKMQKDVNFDKNNFNFKQICNLADTCT